MENAKRNRHIAIAEMQLPLAGFVRLPTVLAHYPVSRAQWWKLCREGIAPKGMKLSERVTAWDANELRAFLAARKVEAVTNPPTRPNWPPRKQKAGSVP